MSTVNIKQIDGPVPVANSENTWTVAPNVVALSAGAAVPLTSTSTSTVVQHYITLQRPLGDTAIAYVGTSACTSAASWCLTLSGGSSQVQLGVRDASKVYVWTAGSGQSIAWSGV